MSKDKNGMALVDTEFLTTNVPAELLKEFERTMYRVRMNSTIEEYPSFVIDAETSIDLIRELINDSKEEISDEEFDKVRESKLDVEFYTFYLKELKKFLSRYNIKEFCKVQTVGEDLSKLLIQMSYPYSKRNLVRTLFNTYREDLKNRQKLTDEMILMDVITSWVEGQVEAQKPPITWTDSEVSSLIKYLKFWLSIVNNWLDEGEKTLLNFSVMKGEYIDFSIEVGIEFFKRKMSHSADDYLKEILIKYVKYAPQMGGAYKTRV